MKKILFIGQSQSIHAIRWINNVDSSKYKKFFFPSFDTGKTHPKLKDVKIYHTFYEKTPTDDSVTISGIPAYFEKLSAALRIGLRVFFPSLLVKRLARVIQNVKPDIIHSFEIQNGSHLTYLAKQKIKHMPTWVVSNWGSDVMLFKNLKEYKNKISDVLESADYYFCECERDIQEAKKMGFKGSFLPVFPNTGGFEIEKIKKLRTSKKTSARKKILLKGYQHWAGRALVGLEALRRIAPRLKGYHLYIHSIQEHPFLQYNDVKIAAEIFEKQTGIPTFIIPSGTSHDEMLQHHSESRISIGLSIGDGISTSFLEAMAMGAFPIQSYTACADEWVINGKTGLLVPPEDPAIIADSIGRALSEDALVDEASEINLITIEKRANSKILKEKINDLYTKILIDKSE